MHSWVVVAAVVVAFTVIPYNYILASLTRWPHTRLAAIVVAIGARIVAALAARVLCVSLLEIVGN